MPLSVLLYIAFCGTSKKKGEKPMRLHLLRYIKNRI